MNWRRCVGIEPTQDSVNASRTGLKPGEPTSDSSISFRLGGIMPHPFEKGSHAGWKGIKIASSSKMAKSRFSWRGGWLSYPFAGILSQ